MSEYRGEVQRFEPAATFMQMWKTPVIIAVVCTVLGGMSALGKRSWFSEPTGWSALPPLLLAGVFLSLVALYGPGPRVVITLDDVGIHYERGGKVDLSPYREITEVNIDDKIAWVFRADGNGPIMLLLDRFTPEQRAAIESAITARLAAHRPAAGTESVTE